MTPPERPQSGDRTQQRALAHPGGTGDQQRMAGARSQRDVLSQRSPVRQVEVECLDCNASPAALDLDWLDPGPISGDLIQPGSEPGETLDDGLVLRNLGVGVNDER